MGYRLIAFLDADTPLEIFRRLVVGSEGTLAFVAEAVFETVPHPRGSTAAMLIFPDIDTAVASVPPLVESGATAVELMLTLTLKAASSFVTIPQEWEDAPWETAAILVEFRSDDPAELAERQAAAEKILADHPLVQPAKFTTDPEVTELYWRVREGMHGLVGRMRPPHTALIVEDVCVAPDRIAECAKDVRELLGEHGFLPGVAGHASAGNLHFMLTPEFAQESERERYDGFMEALVELIVDKYDGSLKAEHGTGVNMAPFVEREWGPKATELMRRVKRLADPDGVLGPGVILNDDPACHLQNLKTTPTIEEDGGADLCVECGFCEPVCPSRDLTTTPRQRIVLRREMARQPAGSPVLDALLEQYEYDGIQTCAADGTCALACPLGIDTGTLIKNFRARERTPRAQRAGLATAKRWATVERASRAGLRARPVSKALSAAGRALLSDELVPAWPDAMPPPAPAKLPATRREGAAAVYLPACINRIFGPSLPGALVRVSERAGVPVWIPDDVPGPLLRGPLELEGADRGRRLDGRAHCRGRSALDRGRAPTGGDRRQLVHPWAARVPRGRGGARLDRVAPRPRPAGARGDPEGGRRRGPSTLLSAPSRTGPEAAPRGRGAGRGSRAPDHRHLLRNGWRPRPSAPRAAAFRHPPAGRGARLGPLRRHVSSNRTCEIGLEKGTGRQYRSVVHLLDELTS